MYKGYTSELKHDVCTLININYSLYIPWYLNEAISQCIHEFRCFGEFNTDQIQNRTYVVSNMSYNIERGYILR